MTAGALFVVSSPDPTLEGGETSHPALRGGSGLDEGLLILIRRGLLQCLCQGGRILSLLDGAEWARMVFEYMMAASERKPFETYNLTDLQILTDAKEIFGVIDDSLASPS